MIGIGRIVLGQEDPGFLLELGQTLGFLDDDH